uniref:OK/SW-CL.4 n=1 Tax=Homo sapiens TaxID=9606 RepID=Q8NI85_HUMAN|nr:OK/SW-CL.4 [Homo sapiens]
MLLYINRARPEGGRGAGAEGRSNQISNFLLIINPLFTAVSVVIFKIFLIFFFFLLLLFTSCVYVGNL